jgi:light-harvesting protein B-800-850 alpha chain
MAAATMLAPGANTAKASFVVPQTDGSLAVTIILPDGSSTQALIQPSQLQPEL